MAYYTIYFLRHLKRETLETCIKEAYSAMMQKDNDEGKIKMELKCLLFHYLKQYNLNHEFVPVCKAVLSDADIKDLEEINKYNYNKLLLIL